MKKYLCLFFIFTIAANATFSEPLVPQEYYDMIAAYFDEGRFHEARALAERAVNLNPKDKTLHSALGNIFFRLGYADLALESLNRAFELDNLFAEAYNMRAGVYILLNDFNRALDDMNMAIFIEPENDRFYRFRGELFIRMGQYENALADLNKAISLNNKVSVYFSNRATVLFRLGRHEEVMADLNTAIRLDSNNYIAHSDRGYINFLHKNAPHEAILDFTEAIRSNPNHRRAYFNRAFIFRHLAALSGDPVQAEYYRIRAQLDEDIVARLDGQGE